MPSGVEKSVSVNKKNYFNQHQIRTSSLSKQAFALILSANYAAGKLNNVTDRGISLTVRRAIVTET